MLHGTLEVIAVLVLATSLRTAPLISEICVFVLLSE